MGVGLRVLRREAARWWWVPLAAGVIWFMIAWLVLRMDVTSLATVGVLVGILFLITAVNEVAVAAFGTGGWKVAHYVLAAVFVLGAAWAFVRPINTFFALASVLGLILFLQGALYIARGIALRSVSPYWGLELLSGVLLALLAFWVSISDRYFGLEGRTVFILIWVGFMALVPRDLRHRAGLQPAVAREARERPGTGPGGGRHVATHPRYGERARPGAGRGVPKVAGWAGSACRGGNGRGL
jgi:uncharacterized membrane protein HdeD (DUF308 family)